MARPDGRRVLSALFDPASVVVVGASNEERKWGNWLARGALRGEHRRRVHLVNRRGGEVLGHAAHTSISEVPGGAELAVVCTPSDQFEAAVLEALACGARAVIGISAGLGETGREGRRLEQSVAARVRQAGAVLLGPNCLGVLDHPGELYLTSNDLPAGSVGLISQSGNLALELGVKADRAGLGFGRFASLGNQADLDVSDLVVDFAAAEHIQAIAVYCEDFRDGRRFLEAAEEATRLGKPVVLLSVGSSAAGVRAAHSHTGALVSGERSIDAACRAAGIERVSTPQELIDALAGFLLGTSPAADRVAVVTDGGGHGAIAADVVSAAGLTVPAFSTALAARLALITGTSGATANPVDLAGAGEQDVWSFARVLEAILLSAEVDSVLLTGYFGGYGQYSEELRKAEHEVASALVALTHGSGRPVVVHTMHDGADFSAALVRLQAGRVPVVNRVEAAASILARLHRRMAATPEGLPELLPAQPRPDIEGYFGARALLEEAGVVFAPARRVQDLDEAVAAARAIGYPVALKAPVLEHKSDAGGVVLGLDDDKSLEAAARAMWERFGRGPLSVEAMLDVASGVELLVGVVRDARFGPVVAVGLGGIHTEVMDDVATGLAPVRADQAARMISSLRGAPLLLGGRGRPRLDLEAASRAVAAVSYLAASRPDVGEIEVNPLLVCPQGAFGLDARMVLETPQPDAGG
ncbi:MAG: acetate--CoA ligase family protein [Acidimicrobiales bacterium]